MIKKITLVVLLFCTIVSCGVKNDPKYSDPEKQARIYKILISKA
jgi:hypothetical protein